jgi:hypothetical protein
MISGVPLETCWALNKLWNNKLCYKVASCRYFYWVILRSTDPWLSNLYMDDFTQVIFSITAAEDCLADPASWCVLTPRSQNLFVESSRCSLSFLLRLGRSESCRSLEWYWRGIQRFVSTRFGRSNQLFWHALRSSAMLTCLHSVSDIGIPLAVQCFEWTAKGGL